MSSSSSSSSKIFTTNRQIRRMEERVKLLRPQQVQRDEAQILEQREYNFKKIYREKADPVFSLPGLRIHYITHLKIKFTIVPRHFSDAFSKRLEYLCRLVYNRRMSRWWVKTNAFPLPCLKKIYSTMHKKVGDDGIIDGIKTIYKITEDWIAKEEKRLLKKYDKLMNSNELGEMELLSSEGELFLDSA